LPLYEYVAAYCLESLFCPKRFYYRQNLSALSITACEGCTAPLERILSSFSAGVDMRAKAEAWTKTDAGSDAPPATLKNLFGGGLGALGCGYHHPDGVLDSRGCERGCGTEEDG
jgi:predicted nucleic acid-binding Zn ribbon protein